jgi:hypothetical protein
MAIDTPSAPGIHAGSKKRPINTGKQTFVPMK